MAIRPIRVMGDPVLKTVCQPITTFDDSVRRLVDDLMETVDDPLRAGLAANQIGVGLRAFSYQLDGRHGYVLNPELIEVSEETITDDEGCLSVPGLWFPTTRATYAVVRGVDVDGEPVTVEGEGMFARCLQHETDHLDGLLYLDRLDRETRKEAMRAIRSQSVSGTAG